MSRPGRIAALSLAALLAAAAAVVPVGSGAHAEPLAVIEGEALDVATDRLELDVERGTALLSGNVSLKVGDLDVRCPQMELRYDRSPRVSWAKGTGGVTARLKGIEATAGSVEFDAGSRSVAFQGAVRLSRGRGWVTAEHATIDIGSGKVSLKDVKGSIPVDPARR
jgi:lipopolysaccharide export system protein LptA